MSRIKVELPNITPGPWQQYDPLYVQAGFHDVLDAQDRTLMFVCSREDEHAAANGKVTACVPEMLEEIKRRFLGLAVTPVAKLTSEERTDLWRTRTLLLQMGCTIRNERADMRAFFACCETE